MNLDEFNKIKNKYGCGYWNVCLEHDCPCTLDSKDFDSDIYNRLLSDYSETINDYNY